MKVLFAVCLVIASAAVAHAQSRRGCTWASGAECGPAPGERTCVWPDRNGEMVDHCGGEARRQPSTYRPEPRPAEDRIEARTRREPVYRATPRAYGRDERGNGRPVTVSVYLCGASERAWAVALANADRQVRAAGGAGFVAGAIRRGCPRGFGDLARAAGEGVTFGAYGDAASIGRICGGGATGCGQMPGAIGFAYVGGNWWDGSTIAHEIGHMAGLGHGRYGDIMAPQAAEGQRVGAAYVRAVGAMAGRGAAYLAPGKVVQ